MADVRISTMPAATIPLTGAELIPVVQAGTNKTITTNDLSIHDPITVTDTGSIVFTLTNQNIAADAIGLKFGTNYITCATTPPTINQLLGYNGVDIVGVNVVNTAINGATTMPIASDWAFVHSNDSTAHNLDSKISIPLTSAHGDILFFNGVDYINLAAGAVGDVLTTQGVGADPIWTTPASGGGTSVIVDIVPVSGNISQAICSNWAYDHENNPNAHNLLSLTSGMLVSLDGPTSVVHSDTVNYIITNYNAFSTYNVSVSDGTVSILGDTITFTAPSTTVIATLTVTQNAVPVNFLINVGTAPVAIDTPINLIPVNGITNQPSMVGLIASNFVPIGGSDTHVSSDWQLATDIGFVNVVDSVSASTVHLTSWTVSGLSVSQTYFWRVRYNGASGATSNWSIPTNFVTNNTFITTPGTIGSPGTLGFGVGQCTVPLPIGFMPMPGHDLPTSDNYGNYQYSDGSIMVWIPKFYYRIGATSSPHYPVYGVNAVDIADDTMYADEATANADGFALHRAFIDGGSTKVGFLVDKFQCSNNSGIASSIRFAQPLSTFVDNNPIGHLATSPANAYYGCIKAAKTRGNNFFCCSQYIRSALAILSIAHAQASASTTACAWFKIGAKFPKGNNNNALGDVNDDTISFLSAGNINYINCAQTGSGNSFAKTTHNGQNCGVADLNGNLWEVSIGTTCMGGQFYTAKTTMAMKDFTDGNSLITDHWGAIGILNNMDPITNNTTTTGRFGNMINQVLDGAVNGNGWHLTSLNLPKETGISVYGTSEFGQDWYFYGNQNDMCAIAGGGWSNLTDAGVWSLYLFATRSHSYANVGFRSAIYI